MKIDHYEETLPVAECYVEKDGSQQGFTAKLRVEDDEEGIQHAEVEFFSPWVDGTLRVCLGRSSEWSEEALDDVEIDHKPRLEAILAACVGLMQALDADPRGVL
jgi:hypothetical protein